MLTGTSMIERVLGYRFRTQHKPPVEWSRRIHHTLAPLGGIFFLYKMFTAGTYHLLTEGFHVSVDRIHFLLDLHDARIPGIPWFSTVWVFLVGIVSFSMIASGLTILRKKPKNENENIFTTP